MNAPIVQWDGKLLQSVTGHEMVDRLPVTISNGNLEQILKVPCLKSGTGKAQADTIFKVLCEWGLIDIVQGCYFDTTAVNTGLEKSTCVLLEKHLQRSLINLACRHHIFEILIRAAFESKLSGTSGPDVALLKKFKTAWSTLDKNKFSPGMCDERIRDLFEVDKGEIISFLHEILENHLPRDDYREFAELCLIFLD